MEQLGEIITSGSAYDYSVQAYTNIFMSKNKQKILQHISW